MYIDNQGRLIHPDNKVDAVEGIYSLGGSANYLPVIDCLFFSTEIPF